MNKLFHIFLMTIILHAGIIKIDGQITENESKKVISVLENEKWWGGAVVDGRKSPFGANFTYNELGNCKGNQASPILLSNLGRFIWSDKPLNIELQYNQNEKDILNYAKIWQFSITKWELKL
jgi:hypothetical protein